MIVLKPSSYSSKAAAKILQVLEQHEVRVVSRGMLPAAAQERSRALGSYFANTEKWAEAAPPSEISLDSEALRTFADVFGVSWSDTLNERKLVNAAVARARLSLDHAALERMWSTAQRTRLAAGIYCAKLDISEAPLFVINGFYGALREQYVANTAFSMYLTVEWDPQSLSWADIQEYIIGDPDPARAEASSIRGALFAHWEELDLPTRPTRETNCVHFSASAFEAMVERLVLCKGAILFSDALGSRLLAHNIPALVVQNWLANPVVDDKPLFQHMLGKGADECVAAATPLLGEHYLGSRPMI